MALGIRFLQITGVCLAGLLIVSLSHADERRKRNEKELQEEQRENQKINENQRWRDQEKLSLLSFQNIQRQKSPYVRIQGRVIFQKRFTQVAQEMCEVGPCYSSQVYWGISIVSESRVYLLNQVFFSGQVRAPEEVEFAGVTLRPGAWIELQAKLESLGSESGILSEVKEIVFIRDLGWSCQAQDFDGSNVFVRVWKDVLDPSSTSFQLRVQREERSGVHTLAYVPSVHAFQGADHLVFAGESSDPRGIRVDLTIHQLSGGVRNLPAELRLGMISRKETQLHEEQAEILESMRLTCSQTRS